jgi:Pyridoxamine 5'-phosphate oxidase
VKAKRGTELQRVRNLRADPRCALLVERYSDDWTQLWWVRVSGRASVCPPDRLESALGTLALFHPRYSASGSVSSVLVLVERTITGWTA